MVKVFAHGTMGHRINFLFQPVLHNWCNKGCGICHYVCGMVHIKDSLLLIEKSSSSSDGSRFFYRYLNGPTPYNRINKMC